MAKKEREFYRTVITVEVLSEDKPINPEDLADVHHMITDGDCNGEWTITTSEKLTPKQTAKALIKQSSDPGYFGLDSSGNLLDSGDDDFDDDEDDEDVGDLSDPSGN
jgi:hypothetical protein